MRGVTRVRALALAFLALLPLSPAAPASVSIPELGDQARISLVTMAPGREIYFAFGHSAFRVVDPSLDMDLMFNYGTFDLSDPLFIPNFVKGDLNYYLGVSDFELQRSFDLRYQNRIWEEQVLDLDAADRNLLFAYLVNNARPENAYYRYDFILDNCATRISKALLDVFGSRVTFRQGPNAWNQTWRQILNTHVEERPLFAFAFSLVLGTRVDQVPDALASTALPFLLRDEVAAAIFTRADGSRAPLASGIGRVLDPPSPPDWDTPLESPSWVLWPLAVLSLLLLGLELGARKHPALGRPGRSVVLAVLDGVWYAFWGIFAVLVVYLSFLSSHYATGSNLSLLWLWPTHVAVPLFRARLASWTWLRWYFGLSALAALVPLLAWPLWPQAMHPLQIPLMLVFAARGLTLAFQAGKKNHRRP